MLERKDPYTGEVFQAKRTNQRFASRKNQVAYNNAKAKEIRDNMSEIDNQVKRNWQILSEALGELEKVVKPKEYLLGCGYNFRFFNNQRSVNDLIYFGVYDYGLRKVEDDNFEIIKFTSHE